MLVSSRAIRFILLQGYPNLEYFVLFRADVSEAMIVVTEGIEVPQSRLRPIESAQAV